MFMSMFIAGLTTKMMDLQRIMSDHKKASRLLNRYLDMHKTTSWSTAFLARFHLEKAIHNKAAMSDEADIVKLLPDHVRGQLLHEVRMPLLRRQRLFLDLDEHFKQAARGICKDAVTLSSVQCTEVVFEKGELGKWMVFVEEGSMRYTKVDGLRHQLTQVLHDGPHLETKFSIRAAIREQLGSKRKARKFSSFEGTELTHGAWAGEASLWVDWKHAGTLIAVVDSTVLKVESETFETTLKQHPEVYHFTAVYAWYFHLELSEEGNPSDVMELNLDLIDRLEEGPPYAWSQFEEVVPGVRRSSLLTFEPGMESPRSQQVLFSKRLFPMDDEQNCSEVACNGEASACVATACFGGERRRTISTNGSANDFIAKI